MKLFSIILLRILSALKQVKCRRSPPMATNSRFTAVIAIPKALLLYGIAICVVMLNTTGCMLSRETAPQPTIRRSFVMDTFVLITVYDAPEIAEPALRAALEEIAEIERIFSYTNPDSELSRINASAFKKPVQVSEYMGFLIRESLRLSELTGGAFDISLGSLIDLWSENRVPAQEQIDELLPLLGYENIIFKDNTVAFSNRAVKMHFGAIAKGFTLDKTRERLIENGFTSALIDIGGEIGIIGDSRRKDGIWRIGVNDPLNNGKIALTLDTAKSSVATSGDYERFFVEDGVKYHHIFDRTTGKPSRSGCSSVTVLTDSGILSDALSTAIFAAGIDITENLAIIDLSEEFCIVIINQEGEITGWSLGGGNCRVGNNFTHGASLDWQYSIR